MTDSQLISTLNTLIDTCKDSEAGFRTAADSVRSAGLKHLFAAIAEERGRLAAELRREVERLGGPPEREGSVAGTRHRGWMNLRAAVTGRDETSIIAAAEAGEDSALRAYERALREPLPDSVRAVVERQHREVRAAHDRVRALERVA